MKYNNRIAILMISILTYPAVIFPLDWIAHTIDATIKGCLSVMARDIDKDGKTE